MDCGFCVASGGAAADICQDWSDGQQSFLGRVPATIEVALALPVVLHPVMFLVSLTMSET